MDEGDGLTNERERVRKLLSLVAHAIGYKMIVGVHNTANVRCMWEVCLLLVGQTSVPAILLMLSGM